MGKISLMTLKIKCSAAFIVLTILAILQIIQEPTSIVGHASMILCIFFDILIYLLFFKKNSLLYKRFHEKTLNEDD